MSIKPDIENTPVEMALVQIKEPPTSQTNFSLLYSLAALAVIGLTWGAVMTGMYVQRNQQSLSTTLRTDATLGIAAISHIGRLLSGACLERVDPSCPGDRQSSPW